MSPSDAPLLICYDRSAGARAAIEFAAGLFPGRQAVVLTIWSFPVEMAVYGLGNTAAYSEESQKQPRTRRPRRAATSPTRRASSHVR